MVLLKSDVVWLNLVTVKEDLIDSHVKNWDNFLWVVDEPSVQIFVKWLYSQFTL